MIQQIPFLDFLKVMQEDSRQQSMSLEITPAVQELKDKLIRQRRGSNNNSNDNSQRPNRYKSFYWSLGYKVESGYTGITNEIKHDEYAAKCNNNCCFVDIIGRPQKHGRDMPLLPYQNYYTKCCMRKTYLD